MIRPSTVVSTLMCTFFCLSIAISQPGLDGPREGVRPIVITPQVDVQRPARGFRSQQPPGYLSITGHAEDLKFSNIGPNVTLGGTTKPGPNSVSSLNRGTSFDATRQDGWIPYDASLAVGPNHVLVCTNAQIEVYSRSGLFVARYSTDPAVGSGFFPADAGVSFDPKCYFDNAGGHFVVLYAQASSPLAFMNIAVSATADPTGSWYQYHLDWTKDGSTPTGNWGDFPSLGYDDRSIYIGANQYAFTGSYKYPKIRVLSKAQLFTGAPATWMDFTNLLNADGTSAFTVKAARMLSSGGSEFLLNTIPGGGGYVTLWRIDNGPASPSLTRVATVNIGTYAVPPNGRQPGGGSVADGDCRTQEVVVRNGIVYTAFTEKYGSKGKRGQGAGCRYLEISSGGTKLADISFNASGVDRYYPAVSVDGSGNVVMTYNQSGPTEYASMYCTGINKGLGETGFEAGSLLKPGAGTVANGRWGDYSGIANDFSNGGACWVFGGWSQSDGSWATHIAAASFGTAPATSPQAGVNERVLPRFALEPNYPNPFNPTTSISYTLREEEHVTLAVFNVLGEQVAGIADGMEAAGTHTAIFDAGNLPGGMYITRLQAGPDLRLIKMILAR